MTSLSIPKGPKTKPFGLFHPPKHIIQVELTKKMPLFYHSLISAWPMGIFLILPQTGYNWPIPRFIRPTPEFSRSILILFSDNLAAQMFIQPIADNGSTVNPLGYKFISSRLFSGNNCYKSDYYGLFHDLNTGQYTHRKRL